MENSKDNIVNLESEEMNGDNICNTEGIMKDLRKEEADEFKTKTLQIIDKLEQVVDCLQQVRDTCRSEREEQIKRQRELFQMQEKVSEMMLSIEKNRNICPRRRPGISLESRVLPIFRSLLRQSGENFELDPADFLEDTSDSEIEENNEAGEEADENNEAEEEADENNEAEEEAEENNEAEEEEEEEERPEATSEETEDYVVEYTPVTSATELPTLAARADEAKRTASSSLEDENKSKKRRLTLVECSVCHEDFPDLTTAGKMLMIARCGHILCSNCAMRIWIKGKKQCPKCNIKYKILELIPVYL